jgi:hypothetical protein
MDAMDRRHGMLLVGSGLLDFAGFQIPVWQCLPRWGGHETELRECSFAQAGGDKV